MRIRTRLPVLLAATLPAAVAGTGLAAQQTSPAHTHVAHVATAFGGTPEGRGLAATASAEAGTALLHANFSAGDLSDLGAMQRHGGHVAQILDPAVAGSGPGLGMGVAPAVEGVVRHIGLAAEAEGASESLRTHAGHVTTIGNGILEVARRAAEVGRRLEAAPSIRRASPLVAELRLLVYHLAEGRDVDGDGQMALDGEAGVQQMEAHLYLLLEGEALPRELR